MCTHQSLHVEQWIMGDPSSGFLHKQYVLEFFLVTLPLLCDPFILMFSFSSACTEESCATELVLDDWRVLTAVVRVDMVRGK